MSLIHGVDLPVPEFQGRLAQMALSGSCFITDSRGNGRYVWAFWPTATNPAAAAAWYMIDLESRSIFPMEVPPIPATCDTTKAGLCYMLGTPGGAFPDDSIMLVLPDTAAPFMWTGEYTIRTDAWAALANLAAPHALLAVLSANGDIRLAKYEAQLALAVGGAVVISENHVYMQANGGNFPGGGGGVSDLAWYNRNTNVWDVVIGGGAVRGGGPGPGATFDWLPAIPQGFCSLRGGGAGPGIIDFYNIDFDSWNPLPFVPAYVAGPGFESCVVRSDPQAIYIAGMGGLGRIDVGRGRMDPLGSWLGADGVAHLGNSLVSCFKQGNLYLLRRRFGVNLEAQRLWVPHPLGA